MGILEYRLKIEKGRASLNLRNLNHQGLKLINSKVIDATQPKIVNFNCYC